MYGGPRRPAGAAPFGRRCQDVIRQRRRFRRPGWLIPKVKIAALAAAMFGVALLLCLAQRGLPAPAVPPRIPVWLLAAVFVATELVLLHVEVGEEAWSY